MTLPASRLAFGQTFVAFFFLHIGHTSIHDYTARRLLDLGFWGRLGIHCSWNGLVMHVYTPICMGLRSA